ncbi:MAG: uroporphyrinogen-III C-methyltransferase [Phycisphaeraceae bacterium]|nr:uroporphyrinogen-III C-methyltransferase [Phycisphaeraceae bacterium]
MDHPESENLSTSRVYLVGAGPGDPAFLTLAALRVIRQADAIVFDALVDRGLLDQSPANCRKIDAGKRAGAAAMSQQQICKTLLDLSVEYRRIVRLKGGDPLVFARGAEEIEFLNAHGIDCRVVPGLTAGLAAFAAGGIVPTHRTGASGILLATGQSAGDQPIPASRYQLWASAIAEGTTLLLYMAARNAAEHLARLIEAGLDAHTPAAMVQWATWDQQRMVRATAGTLGPRARDAGLGPPAMLMLGVQVDKVLKFTLDRGRQGELEGISILVLRAAGQADSFAEEFRRRGAKVYTAPMIRIAPPPHPEKPAAAIRQLDRYGWLVLCSINGVRQLARILFEAELDSRALAGVAIATVGRATAMELKRLLGITADLVGRDGGSAGLCRELRGLPAFHAPGTRVLVLKSEQSVSDWTALRQDAGAEVDEVALYRTEIIGRLSGRKLTLLRQKRVDWILVKSPSMAEGLARAIEASGEPSELPPIASIGPTTSARLRELGLTPAVEGEQPTASAVARALQGWRGGSIG